MTSAAVVAEPPVHQYEVIKMRETSTYDDDEAVSITTGFIINLGIATVAVSIFLFHLQGLFVDVTDRSAETQLSVAGERLAEEIERVDRLSNRQGQSEINATVELPRFESRYTAEIVANSSGGNITMKSSSGDSSVTVSFTNHTKIVDATDGITRNGGTTVRVRHDPSAGGIVIE